MKTRHLRTVAALLALLVSAVLTFAGNSTHAAVRSNTAGITGLDADTAFSGIDVGGVGGVVTNVRVTLNDVSHDFPDDMDVMLHGPNGQRVILMGDACGSDDLLDVDITIDSGAATASPIPNQGPCPSGIYQPADHAGEDGWSLPPTADDLVTAFAGINPNGLWTLEVVDDAFVDVTNIGEGWTLDIETGPASAALPGGTGTSGKASPYPTEVTVSGTVGTISDVNVRFTGLYHPSPDDLEVLMVGPQGQTVTLMSDACGGDDLVDGTVTFNDDASAALPDEGPCVGQPLRPFDHDSEGQTDDLLPAPAPTGPYGQTLSVFDGTKPNGTWRFYMVDDKTTNAGFLVEAPQILLTLEPPLLCQGKEVTVDLNKGQATTGGPDIVLGTPDADIINARSGNDTICGLAGDDIIQGSAGNDFIDGGAGQDTASYNSATEPVTASLGATNGQNTGPATGIDTLKLIENLSGGAGDDKLVGNSSHNNLQGRAGNDTLIGSAGADTLSGGVGTDTCYGGDGTDTASSCETKTTIP